MSAFTAADISVVVPIYNRADKVGAVLDTVFVQTLLPAEVIVVDDGSTDGTADRIRLAIPDYARRGVDIRLIEQPNGGPGAARNTGVAAARGGLIAFLDSDDQWLPRKTEAQLAHFNAALAAWPNLALADTFSEIVEGGVVVGTQRKVKAGPAFEDFLRRNAINATASVFCRRDVFLEAGGFDVTLRYAEDRLLWTRIAHRHAVTTLPEVMVKKINSPNNLTSGVERNLAYKEKYIDMLIGMLPELQGRRAELVRYNLLPFVNALAQGDDPRKAASLYGRLVRQDPGLVLRPETLVAAASLFGKGSVRALETVGGALGMKRRFRPQL
jgi:glycosyltransferase involved in cell wall biosynthesis